MATLAPVWVWLDLEMTGLDPALCSIVQIAVVITDKELTHLAPPLELTVWQPEDVLQRMSPFVAQMHTRSGLLDKVRRSQICIEEAQNEVMALIGRYAPYRHARLCGNSISQDRKFLKAYMPAVDSYLHYRQIDVSTFKELASAWSSFYYRKPKDGQHTALCDVLQSIEELRQYRAHLWHPAQPI